MIDLNAFPQHKQDTGSLGYIYVIHLSTGVVKAGRTRNPRNRIAEHVRGASIHGITVVDAWLSKRHDNWCENETALLRMLGDAEYGYEYFRVDFDEAVAAARSLTYFVLSDEERGARDAADKVRGEAFARALLGPNPQGDVVRVHDNPLATWVLRQLFDDQLPGRAIDEADPAEVKAVMTDYADRAGRDVHEVMNWTYIEVLEHLAELVIRGASLDLQIKAWEGHRLDLVREPFFSKEQTS